MNDWVWAGVKKFSNVDFYWMFWERFALTSCKTC